MSQAHHAAFKSKTLALALIDTLPDSEVVGLSLSLAVAYAVAGGVSRADLARLLDETLTVIEGHASTKLNDNGGAS
jgi:hypothetical protein